MNRKRFLKLLMARGIQRRDAQTWAMGIRNIGSYSELYVLFIMENGYFMGDMVRILKEFFKAYEETARIFQKEVIRLLGTAAFKAGRINGRNISYENIANFSEKYQRAELVGRKNADE